MLSRVIVETSEVSVRKSYTVYRIPCPEANTVRKKRFQPFDSAQKRKRALLDVPKLHKTPVLTALKGRREIVREAGTMESREA